MLSGCPSGHPAEKERDEMQKRCVICGKPGKLVANPSHPEKQICIKCLNGFLENVKTIEEELDPLVKALSKGAEALKRELDKRQKE